MKLTMFFLLIFSQISNAQVDSLLKQLEYYPLHIGDYWEYEQKQSQYGTDTEISYYSVEVTDRKLQRINMKYYYVILEKSITPDDKYTTDYAITYYQRIDTLSGNVYQYDSGASNSDYEKLILSLYAQPWGTIELPGYILSSIDTTKYFGLTTIVQTFIKPPSSGKKVVKKFGVSRIWNVYGSSASEINLIRTNINDDEHNPNSISKKHNDIDHFHLLQNHPNPFNNSTIIRYYIKQSGFTILKIYDILGREIDVLVNKDQNAGSHSVTFNSKDLPSGIYVYQLQFQGNYKQKKLLILN